MSDEETISLQRSRIAEGLRLLRQAAEEEARRIRERLEDREQRILVVGLPPPPPIDLFQGRRRELDDLAQSLTSDRVRIVAISGASGMGKTALARKLLNDLEVGRWPRDDVPELDGIAYLSARTSGISFERVYFDCAQMLGSDKENRLLAIWRQEPRISAKASHLLKELRDGNYIVLLDNLEDELDEQGRVRDEDLQYFLDLLRGPSVNDSARVLITSREGLAALGDMAEYQRDVPLRAGLSNADSLAVLRRLDPSGQLGLSNLSDDDAVALVELFGGVPRALELVASLRMRNKLSLDELRPSIALQSGPGELILPALAALHYEALDEDEKIVADALAVLRRPVPIVAVDFVLELESPGLDVPAVLQRMRDRYTITYETFSSVRTPLAIVSLHPADSEVALGRMNRFRLKNLHFRAAEYYSQVRLPTPWFRIRHLEPQLLEFEHSLAAGDPDRAANVLDSIDYSWTNHHKYLAYLMFLGFGNHAIAQRKKLQGLLSPGDKAVENRVSLGWTYRRMGLVQEADYELRGAVNDAAEAKVSTDSQAFALTELGYFLTDNAGKHDEAEIWLVRGLELARSTGDAYKQAHALLGLAFADFQRQRNDSSSRNATHALTLFRSVTENVARFREVDCLVRLGMIHRKTGNLEAAIATAREGLRIAGKHGLEDWCAELHSGIGFHRRARGEFDLALKHHGRSLRLFKQLRGMKREEAVQYSYAANLYMDTGALDDSLRTFEEADRVARSINLRREVSWILANMGVLHTRMGEHDRAVELIQEALVIVTENGHFDSQVLRYGDLAGALLAMGDFARAETALLMAMRSEATDALRPLPERLPEAYTNAPYMEDKLPQEMQSPADHERRGVHLAQLYLRTDRPELAWRALQAARRSPVASARRHATAGLQALVSLRLGRLSDARLFAEECLQMSRDAVQRCRRNYAAVYSEGLAHAVLGTAHGGSAESDEHISLSGNAYARAAQLCRAPGVLQEADTLLKQLTGTGPQRLIHQLRSALTR